ncbi:MAG TPA: tetratricopeptide repeat protein [Terriglobales bacterium]
MRFTVTLLLLAYLAAGRPSQVAADVIHLKNGRTIAADHVRESGTRVEYDVGDNTFAVPKDLVERVETGAAPASPAAQNLNSSDAHGLPAPATQDYKYDASLNDMVIHDAKADDDAVAALEASGNAKKAAAGNFIAGKFEFDHGNFAKARTHLEAALRFDPDDPTLLNYYSSLLVRTGNASQALSYAERSARNAPDSPDTLTVLGYVQFANGHTKDAIETWKHSLELRPDALVEQYLKRAEHESAAEANFSEKESGHFILKFEGDRTPESLREQLLQTLESDYDDLVRTLGVAPHDSIMVTLYTNQAFFDVTQAPSWTGALNDGKLRIPIRGIDSVTPELARVIKHELAHSFINQLSAGRCPSWLNEGIAQALEPKQIVNGKLLASMFRDQKEIPLNAMESSFMSLSPAQAAIAYDESLAAVQFITDTNGMSDLQRVLQRLSEGSSTEAALRAFIHSDYAQLESDLGKYLGDKYPE